MDTKPFNKAVLVELVAEYAGISTIEKKYDSCQTGTILKFADDIEELTQHEKHELVGQIGRWRQYKDDLSWKQDGKKYALIEYKDIMGIRK